VGDLDVKDRHLVFDGLTPHRVLDWRPVADGHRYAVVEFRFREACPLSEAVHERKRMRGAPLECTGGVLKTLLRYANRDESVRTDHLQLKRVAATTVRPEAIELAAWTHPAVRYLMNSYWATVVREIRGHSPLLHSPMYALHRVRLTALQVQEAVRRGLCEAVTEADLPSWFIAFAELVGLWLVLDKDPALGRLIVHLAVLNEHAPPPEVFFFPSPFQIVRDFLARDCQAVRICDARSYYWQFLAAPWFVGRRCASFGSRAVPGGITCVCSVITRQSSCMWPRSPPIAPRYTSRLPGIPQAEPADIERHRLVGGPRERRNDRQSSR